MVSLDNVPIVTMLIIAIAEISLPGGVPTTQAATATLDSFDILHSLGLERCHLRSVMLNVITIHLLAYKN